MFLWRISLIDFQGSARKNERHRYLGIQQCTGHLKSCAFVPTGNQTEGWGLSESSSTHMVVHVAQVLSKKSLQHRGQPPSFLSALAPPPPHFPSFFFCSTFPIQCVLLFLKRNCGEIYIKFIILTIFKCVVLYIHIVVQPCQHPSPELSSPQTETLYPLNANSSPRLPPAPGDHLSTFCLHECDYSMHLT